MHDRLKQDTRKRDAGFGPVMPLDYIYMGPSSNGKATARLAEYGEFDSPRTYQKQ